MINQKLVKFKNFADVNPGQSPKSEFYSDNEGLPFLQGNRTFGLLYPKIDTYTTKVTKIAEEGEILMSVRAPVGDLNFAKEKVCIGRGIAGIKAKDGDNKFLFYCLKYNISNLIRQGGGTTYDSVNKDIIKDLDLIMPSTPTERKIISKVLSDLDAKIEVNNKINAELEAMAKTLYDYWFVQFDFPNTQGKPYKSSGGKMVFNEELKREIPEGWDNHCFENLGNFKNGVNYDPSNPGEIPCPIINVRNISASRYFLKNEDLDVIYLRENDVKKYSVNKDSIIIARSGIPGATRLIADYEENTLYCGFAIHYCLKNIDDKNIIFFYLKSIEEIIKNGSGGTILKNVNQATLNSLKIALPNSREIIDLFNQQINPIFLKMNQIQQENQKLSELRDWLLPMLMNGQVTVGKAQEELEKVVEK